MSNIIEITDLSAPQLDIYARLSEVQLLRYYEPKNGLLIAESPNVILRALDAGYEPISLLLEKKHIDGQAKGVIARCGDIPIYAAQFDVLTQLTGFQLTRGALCAMRRPHLPSVDEVCKDARRIVVLENVMNPTNIGAIFRSAAALNMDAVLLTPACSDPLYRRASRVSMGTVFQIPWTYLDRTTLPCQTSPLPKASPTREKRDSSRQKKTAGWPEPGMTVLKKLGFKTIAMALRDDSYSIHDPRLHAEEKLAIILGTEGDGLANETIAVCDYTVKIPMAHGVDSLNVAAASAVAFWELGNLQNS